MSILKNTTSIICEICNSYYVDNYSPHYILSEFFGDRAIGAAQCNCGGYTEFLDVPEKEILEKIPFAVKMLDGVYSVKLPDTRWGKIVAEQGERNFRMKLKNSFEGGK